MSRHQLSKRAKELGEQLGQDVELRDLSNSEIEQRIAALEAQIQEQAELPEGPNNLGPLPVDFLRSTKDTGAVNRSGSDVSAGGPPRFAYQVAPGRTIKCRRGVLPRGHEVRAEWVGGADALDKLVADGVVLRGPLARGNHPQS